MEMEDLENIHKGKAFIVSGCGPSAANMLPYLPFFITIGVNYVGKYFNPNYLLMIDSKKSFVNHGKWENVLKARPEISFIMHSDCVEDLEKISKHIIFMQTTTLKHGHLAFEGGILSTSTNSPFVAINLAVYMGASVIGLIGVDLTGNHTITQLIDVARYTEEHYANLVTELKKKDINLWNVSDISNLKAVPFKPLKEFVLDERNLPESVLKT